MIRFRMDRADCAKMVCLWPGCGGGKDESRFEPLKLDRWLGHFLGWRRLGRSSWL